MDIDTIKQLIGDIRAGKLDEAQALAALRSLPFTDLGHTKVDHHRALRQGAAEVIFAPGKTVPQILAILAAMLPTTREVLISRASPEQARAIVGKHRRAVANPIGRTVRVPGRAPKAKAKGGPDRPPVMILSGGTADGPVVEETRETLIWLGLKCEAITDVGVSGIHRLLAHHQAIDRAAVIIVVAGMEGALASVVGGMVAKPVIGVPTAVGYGAGAGGLAALLGMLNSCASGVTVMNIDNGFGAACAAARILRLLDE
jgi:pyridinium-3,5-biscarboxylic acid mononucleotide synthase